MPSDLLSSEEPDAPFAGGHPVVDLINRRALSGSLPGRRDDEARLALVIEGGGMRGVVAGGMVTALTELGLQDAFDFVVGTSAGALAGAFFLAGQARLGTSIYYEDLIGRDWLDYRRAFGSSSIIALDYLFDELMVGHKALEWDLVLRSKTPLHAVATRWNGNDRGPEVFGGFETRDELRTALRASARIPIMTGKPVRLRDEYFLDGALSEAIPMRAAEALGATHMLVLLTRPRERGKATPGRARRFIAFHTMNLLLDGLGDVYAERAPLYERELAHLERLQQVGLDDDRPVALGVQLPPDAELVGQLEQDPYTLLKGASAGAAAVQRALTGSERRDPFANIAFVG